MTIREMESLAEMEWTAIRFYEREGLIQPGRGKNGAREYSKDDLPVLLRIRLLRVLGFSPEEIRGFMDGTGDLADMAAVQAEKLARERRDTEGLREVCRVIAEQKADFAALDAARHLAYIRRTAGIADNPLLYIKNDRLPQAFMPWRRYFARTLDFLIYGVLWDIVLALVFRVNMAATTGYGWRIMYSFISVFIMLALEPLWLRLFGTTPGKAVLGLYIEPEGGGRLSYREGLKRTWCVFGKGLGYNIPVYNLKRAWKCYQACAAREAQPWDLSVSYTLRDERPYRYALYAAVCAAGIFVMFAAYSASWLPPNRGPLTVAQFTENYNYYVRYLGLESGGLYLDAEGKWEEREQNGVIYGIAGDDHTQPELFFYLENGAVRGVSLRVEEKNGFYWMSAYDGRMMAAALAIVGAQKEMGLFSRIPERIARLIDGKGLRGFSTVEAGIAIACEVEYSGYTEYQSAFLIPQESGAQGHFRLEYTLDILS